MVDSNRSAPTVAVILAGAVAKGAFEAGALEVLAQTNARVVRIVAASSGGLNGVAYAAAVRARRERDGAAELAQLWRDHATWMDMVHLDFSALVHLQAISDLSRVRNILRTNIRPARIDAPAPINLRIVLATLDGANGDIGGHPATTFEHMVEFDDATFDDAATLDEVFTAVLASASFPFVFSPTTVPGAGRCIDGGAVNNTPVGYALGDTLGEQLDAVIVISPTVEKLPAPPGELHGAAYITQLVEMLINERLYRDLHEAESRNAALRTLAQLPPDVLTPTGLDAVRRALGWENARPVEIVQIRPLEPLVGSAFSAFRDAGQRGAYIATGAERARDVLGALRWL